MHEEALLTVEVGGSSTQALLNNHEVSLQNHTHLPWLVAAPGLVEGDRVRGAHHLGWADVRISQELGMASAQSGCVTVRWCRSSSGT